MDFKTHNLKNYRILWDLSLCMPGNLTQTLHSKGSSRHAVLIRNRLQRRRPGIGATREEASKLDPNLTGELSSWELDTVLSGCILGTAGRVMKHQYGEYTLDVSLDTHLPLLGLKLRQTGEPLDHCECSLGSLKTRSPQLT